MDYTNNAEIAASIGEQKETQEEKEAKEYLVFELMLSLNQGNSDYTDERYETAKEQVEQMVRDGVNIVNIYEKRIKS